jgi:hypothetical protein
MLGVFVPGQFTSALWVTILLKHLSAPEAVAVSVYGGQESSGAV